MARTPTPHRRPTRHATAAAVILAVGGLLTLAGRPALASALRCGATITANTTLHADLTNCVGDGLVIGADNITLDLRGHTIDGDATPATTDPDAGIKLAGHHGVTLTGGTVQEFDTGVLLDGAPSNSLRRLTVLRSDPGRGIDLENHSDGNRIEDNTSSNNARSGIVIGSSADNLVRGNVTRANATGIAGLTATHNRIEGNVAVGGSNALLLDDFSDDNVVIANVASGALEDGIHSDGKRNVIARNRVIDNPSGIEFVGDGLRVVGNFIADTIGGCPECVGIGVGGGADNVIEGNIVTSSPLDGIRLNPDVLPLTRAVVRANLVHNAAGDGISIATNPRALEPVTDVLLEANVVTRSGHDGINVASTATTLTRNLAVHNTNLGIEAVPGVTDGGGNHAFGNGNPLQCINIAC